jgi:hypothetical protein
VMPHLQQAVWGLHGGGAKDATAARTMMRPTRGSALRFVPPWCQTRLMRVMRVMGVTAHL